MAMRINAFIAKRTWFVVQILQDLNLSIPVSPMSNFIEKVAENNSRGLILKCEGRKNDLLLFTSCTNELRAYLSVCLELYHC